jgi:hypothetical protein
LRALLARRIDALDASGYLRDATLAATPDNMIRRNPHPPPRGGGTRPASIAAIRSMSDPNDVLNPAPDSSWIQYTVMIIGMVVARYQSSDSNRRDRPLRRGQTIFKLSNFIMLLCCFIAEKPRKERNHDNYGIEILSCKMGIP